MSFWIKGAIATVLWFVVCFGVFFLWPGPSTPEADAHASRILGQALVFGLVPVWGAVWMFGTPPEVTPPQRPGNPRSPPPRRPGDRGPR